MTDPKPTRRRFRPTPAWLIFGLLVVEGLLWLSERYRWFWFNEKKGWTVLIAVAVVGVAMLVMLLWFVASLVFRWRFQFSIRSLLVLTVAVAMPCSWLAVEMKKAKEEKELLEAIMNMKGGGAGFTTVSFEPSHGTALLRTLLGDKFFAHLKSVVVSSDGQIERLKGLTPFEDLCLKTPQVTDAGLAHIIGLAQLQDLRLEDTRITDKGLIYIAELSQLRYLQLHNTSYCPTKITDEGVKKLQQSLPNCGIDR